jgi:hypothetical protein
MEGENRAQRLGGFGWRVKRNPCATCSATAAPIRARISPNNIAAPMARLLHDKNCRQALASARLLYRVPLASAALARQRPLGDINRARLREFSAGNG